MLCYKRRGDIDSFLKIVKAKQQLVGFVPTMGALHDGHLSLLETCKKENQISVCSIFVNPTQFNQKEDFDKYPITTQADLLKLAAQHCDVVFLPTLEDIYPNGTQSMKQIDLGNIVNLWEGQQRPGHFDGVAQVVDLLLDIVQPDNLYMGQKDFQQTKVVERLINQLHPKIHLHVCPTEREVSGLAMSSRNTRLSEQEKVDALSLSKALFHIKSHYLKQDPTSLIEEAKQLLINNPAIKLEYLGIVSQANMEPITNNDPTIPAIAIVAAWVGSVRLIDNMLL